MTKGSNPQKNAGIRSVSNMTSKCSPQKWTELKGEMKEATVQFAMLTLAI